jgi:hypothetical protein
MVHDRPTRQTPWAWIIAACFAAGLGTMALLQFRVDRENQARQVAWAAAANRQLALSRAAQIKVEHYRETHNFGHENKPTLEEFCKDCNDGHPLGKDGVWQDPTTGGRVVIFTEADGTFGDMANSHFPQLGGVPHWQALWEVRQCLQAVFFLSSFLLSITCLVPFPPPQRQRIALGQWLVCLSFSLAFLAFLARDAMARDWGLGFLAIGGLYLARAMFLGRETDPTPRCAKCRYNLTGNASGICPECGTAVALA